MNNLPNPHIICITWPINISPFSFAQPSLSRTQYCFKHKQKKTHATHSQSSSKSQIGPSIVVATNGCQIRTPSTVVASMDAAQISFFFFLVLDMKNVFFLFTFSCLVHVGTGTESPKVRRAGRMLNLGFTTNVPHNTIIKYRIRTIFCKNTTKMVSPENSAINIRLKMGLQKHQQSVQELLQKVYHRIV